MDFIINNLLPVLGTTVVGLAIIILLIFIVLIITIIVKIKDYKDVKENIKELISDIKKTFFGRSNKKRRIVLLSSILIVVVTTITISTVIHYNNIEKQIKIISPSYNAVIDVQDETLITWEAIPKTYQYFITIRPATQRMYNADAAYEFYVDGKKTGVKIKIGDFINVTGDGKYYISISSDAYFTSDEIVVDLINYQSNSSENE